MKLVIATVIGIATIGSLVIMCSLMHRYAVELEEEREFIITSSNAIKDAFSEITTSTDILLSQSNETLHSPHSVVKSTTTDFDSNRAVNQQFGNTEATAATNTGLVAWTSRFLGPSLCDQHHRRNIFHLHMRKAAGTTVRNYLQGVASESRNRYIESEGISISSRFGPLAGTTTVVSLRHPVDRIFSMYWYEHVAWWHEIKKDMSKCSTMKNWIEAWRDGSSWKTEFMSKNPGSTYVEVENYYVKTLTGWRGPGKVTRADLAAAKKTLTNFDVIIIAEWLQNETQKSFLKSVFSHGLKSSHNENRGDPKSRQELKSTLLPESGEAQIRRVVSEMNDLDVELWDFAINLAKSRLDMHKSFTDFLAHSKSTSLLKANIAKEFMEKSGFSCFKVADDFNVAQPLPSYLASQVGLFRPPLHKGPL